MKNVVRIAAVVFICLIGYNCPAQSLERYRNLKDTTFLSQNLNYKKHIQITVPIEYQNNLPQKFPVIVIFDMQNQRSYNYILKTIDYLTANEQMPSCVIVGVDAGQGAKRFLETQLTVSDSAGLGEKNEQYIFNELLPLAKQKFKASDFTLLIGHSRYGYFTSYLLTKKLNSLNAVISISPFIEQQNISLPGLLKSSIDQSKLNHTVYYRFAMGNDYPDDYKKLSSLIKQNNFIDKNVNADGWFFPQADHNATPGFTISRSLYDIFEYWLTQQNLYLHGSEADLKKVGQYKNTIQKHYGTELNFALGVLNGKGWEFYNKLNYRGAIEAWQLLVTQCPNFCDAYLNIAKCQKKLNLPITETLVSFKQNIGQSEIFTEKQKADMLKEADELTKN